MRSEDRRDNEALYNKMTIREMAENFTEPAAMDDIQVKVCLIWFFTSHQQSFSYKVTGLPGLNQY